MITAIRQREITQEIFDWQDLSRGFHGGEFHSKEILVFDGGDEDAPLQTYLAFRVKQYTSDSTDFFGTCVPAWELYVDRLENYFYQGTAVEERSSFLIAPEYSSADKAKEYCEYALASYLKHGNFGCLPYCELAE
jgi:hypothetical protein